VSEPTPTESAPISDAFAKLERFFDRMPKQWDGRESVSAMKDGGSRQWKQMEWPGWFLEFLAENDPDANQIFSGTKFGFCNTTFDGFAGGAPWDLKSHVTHDKNGREQLEIMLNDVESSKLAVEEHGALYVAVLSGRAEFDEDGSFYAWHEATKDGKSEYQLRDPSRPSRIRKASVSVTSLDIFNLELEELTVMQKGWKNSDGSLREGKYALNTSTVKPVKTFSC